MMRPGEIYVADFAEAGVTAFATKTSLDFRIQRHFINLIIAAVRPIIATV